VTGGTESEGFAPELIISDSTQTAGPPVRWGGDHAVCDAEMARLQQTLVAETERAERAYANGWRDCALSLAAELDEASKRPGHPQATASQVRYAKGSLQAAAELARRQAQSVPDAPADADPVPVDPADRTKALSLPDGMDPLFEVPND
jgi:hypothetical protein